MYKQSHKMIGKVCVPECYRRRFIISIQSVLLVYISKTLITIYWLYTCNYAIPV